MHAHAIKLLEVVLPALDEDIAATCVYAVFDHRNVTTNLFTRRVFGAVDEAAQIALFNPAEAVDLFLHLDAIAKRLHRRLGNREVHIVAQRKDMDQHVKLRGRRQTFSVRDKIFQLFRPFTAAKLTPDVIAKGNDRTEVGIREFSLEGGQFIYENFTGRAQGIHIPFHIGFDPNRRAAMFWQNAALNLRHRSS
jgi:hypothetical protein